MDGSGDDAVSLVGHCFQPAFQQGHGDDEREGGEKEDGEAVRGPGEHDGEVGRCEGGGSGWVGRHDDAD